MAGDWIKMRTDLYRDPKVSVIADHLMDLDGELAAYVDQNTQRCMTVTRNVMRNVTVGALVSVWGVMRQRGKRRDEDMVCDGVTLSVIDDISDLPGFGTAMALAGWVIETTNGIEFPRFFEAYNVDPEEKSKEKNAERQQRFRDRQKANEAAKSDVKHDVTNNVTVTHREEKRREEKKEPPSVVARATKTCPLEFVVTDELREWAKTETPGVNLDRETAKMRDHAFKTARLDWVKVWRNWMREAADRLPPSRPGELHELFARGSA